MTLELLRPSCSGSSSPLPPHIKARQAVLLLAILKLRSQQQLSLHHPAVTAGQLSSQREAVQRSPVAAASGPGSDAAGVDRLLVCCLRAVCAGGRKPQGHQGQTDQGMSKEEGEQGHRAEEDLQREKGQEGKKWYGREQGGGPHPGLSSLDGISAWATAQACSHQVRHASTTTVLVPSGLHWSTTSGTPAPLVVLELVTQRAAVPDSQCQGPSLAFLSLHSSPFLTLPLSSVRPCGCGCAGRHPAGSAPGAAAPVWGPGGGPEWRGEEGRLGQEESVTLASCRALFQAPHITSALLQVVRPSPYSLHCEL